MSFEQPSGRDDCRILLDDLVRAGELDSLPPTVFGRAAGRAAVDRDGSDRFVLWNRIVQ